MYAHTDNYQNRWTIMYNWSPIYDTTKLDTCCVVQNRTQPQGRDVHFESGAIRVLDLTVIGLCPDEDYV